jgi:hypothetical protein
MLFASICGWPLSDEKLSSSTTASEICTGRMTPPRAGAPAKARQAPCLIHTVVRDSPLAQMGKFSYRTGAHAGRNGEWSGRGSRMHSRIGAPALGRPPGHRRPEMRPGAPAGPVGDCHFAEAQGDTVERTNEVFGGTGGFERAMGILRQAPRPKACARTCVSLKSKVSVGIAKLAPRHQRIRNQSRRSRRRRYKSRDAIARSRSRRKAAAVA